MKDIDLIVFDWDGTLIDSTGMIADCIQAACRDLDLPVPPHRATQFIIGLGMHDALRFLLPDLPPAEYPRLALRYRDHFLNREADIALFAGVEALLEELVRQGYALAIATGKTRIGLDRALQGTGARRWFGATRCADECFSKPHPAMLQQLIAHFEVIPERTLMVGDTIHDLQMAANAGCHAVAVAAGAHSREQLATLAPLACLDSIADLGPWLNL